MAEKRLSGEEQRAQMKEAYKRDLKLRKQFLEDVKEHKRQKTLTDAVIEITSANEQDDTDVWVEKLNQKSAVSEAKMEMAMDSVSISSSPAVDEQARLAMSDAEIRKLKAQELVAQMKAEMENASKPLTPQPEVPSVEVSLSTPEITPPTSKLEAPAAEAPAKKMLEDI